MPTDPSLILNAAENFPQIAPNPQTLINNQLGADKLTLFNQQQQGVNALKDLYSDPSNLVNGKPTPEALQKLTAAAPQQGLDLRRQLMQDDQTQVQLSLARAKEGDAVLRQKMIIAQEAQEDYQENLKTMTPAQALATTQRNVWTPGRAELAQSGLVSPDALTTMPSNFDPQRVGRSLNAWNQAMITPEQRFEQSEKLKADTRSDTELGINQQKATTEQFDKPENVEYLDKDGKKQTGVATYDKVARNFILDDGSGTVVKPTKINKSGGATNPKAEAFDAFMQAHPDATPEQQAAFVQSTGSAPRSAPAMAVRQFMKENPDADSGQVIGFASKYGEVVKAARDFGTGQQGNQLRSLGAVANHFDTLDDLGKNLGNTNERTINRLRAAIKTEFGIDAVPNFDLAKKIVGDEVVKAVIGNGAGGVTDRAALQADFDRANSPAQLSGVINTAKKLIAGQFDALRQQYYSSTFGDKNKEYGIDDFNEKLTPGAKELLKMGGKPTTEEKPPPAGSNAAALPPLPMPIIGETRGKFHFTGGNPADPKSWAPNQ